LAAASSLKRSTLISLMSSSCLSTSRWSTVRPINSLYVFYHSSLDWFDSVSMPFLFCLFRPVQNFTLPVAKQEIRHLNIIFHVGLEVLRVIHATWCRGLARIWVAECSLVTERSNNSYSSISGSRSRLASLKFLFEIFSFDIWCCYSQIFLVQKNIKSPFGKLGPICLSRV
jgi:hypothetical protein